MLNRIDVRVSRDDVGFDAARAAALKAAGTAEHEPTIVSWYDNRHHTHSPNGLSGKDNQFIIRDYAEKWGSTLEVDVNDEYTFTFFDTEGFEGHDSSPYINVEDKEGEWFMCLSGSDVSRDTQTPKCCTHMGENNEVSHSG